MIYIYIYIYIHIHIYTYLYLYFTITVNMFRYMILIDHNIDNISHISHKNCDIYGSSRHQALAANRLSGETSPTSRGAPRMARTCPRRMRGAMAKMGSLGKRKKREMGDFNTGIYSHEITLNLP